MPHRDQPKKPAPPYKGPNPAPSPGAQAPKEPKPKVPKKPPKIPGPPMEVMPDHPEPIRSGNPGGTGNTSDTYDDDRVTARERLNRLLERRSIAVGELDRPAIRALNRRIARFLEDHPNNESLWEAAEDAGFNTDRLEDELSKASTEREGQADGRSRGGSGIDGTGSPEGPGGGGGGAGDPGKPPNLRALAKDNRLLGELGKDFNLVRGPRGTFAAVYKYKLGGEVVKVAINLGKDPEKLSKYGLKASDAKSLNKQQMKQIQGIGWADELAPHIRKGDKHVMKSLTRHLRNQYGGQAILENDEVMSVVIANSMFGWTAGEFENRLRQTKLYQNTNDYQRNWVTVTSPKQKADTVKQMTESIIDVLEDQYGFEWAKYVDGKQVKDWAEKIASGKFGDPGAGLAFWSERQEDKAAAIVGTPAYVRQQTEAESVRGYMNRPEDKKEALMSQARAYLGPHYVPDNATLLAWATDIVTEKKTDADWMNYLRKTSRALHPYKSEDTPWQDFASPYRAAAERVFGTTIEWGDAALSNLQGTKPDGTPLGTPMAAYEFEQYLRDNDPRFWANPDTEERGRAFGQELLAVMGGV